MFFKLDDLPAAAQQAGRIRDQLLLRVIGSPDPYGKQIDGMGGASSSTSKTVILSKVSKKIMMWIICLVRYQLIDLLWTGVVIVAI